MSQTFRRLILGLTLALAILVTEIAPARKTYEGSRPRQQRSFADRFVDRFDQDTSSEVLRATDGVIEKYGYGKGYTLNGSVGLPKIGSHGEFIAPNNKRSNCTTATFAVFLKTISDLHKAGKIDLEPQHIKMLNSPLLWNTWNANGYSIMQVIADLGGTVHKGRAIRDLKPGDFVKIDRKNGTGHTVVFTGFKGGKICYWSSNKRTNGFGEKCESMSSNKITAARLPPAHILGAKLDDLNHELSRGTTYASVRKKGSRAYVSLAGIKALVTPEQERSMASLDGTP